LQRKSIIDDNEKAISVIGRFLFYNMNLLDTNELQLHCNKKMFFS